MGSLYVYFLVPLLVASLSANMSPSPRRIVIVTRMVATPPPKASSRETTSADLPMNIKRELKKAYKLHLRHVLVSFHTLNPALFRATMSYKKEINISWVGGWVPESQ